MNTVVFKKKEPKPAAVSPTCTEHTMRSKQHLALQAVKATHTDKHMLPHYVELCRHVPFNEVEPLFILNHLHICSSEIESLKK